MRLKTIIAILLVAAILVCFAGCKEKPELEPYIKPTTSNVGDTQQTGPIVSEQPNDETIVSTDTDPVEESTDPTATDNEWPDPEKELANKKALFNVLSDWTANGVLTDAIYTETASLQDGGTVEIMFYYGFYQQTTFTTVQSNSDENAAQAESFLESYLERELTDYEVFVMKTALENVNTTNDIVNIYGIEGLSAYAIKTDSSIQIICG